MQQSPHKNIQNTCCFKSTGYQATLVTDTPALSLFIFQILIRRMKETSERMKKMSVTKVGKIGLV